MPEWPYRDLQGLEGFSSVVGGAAAAAAAAANLVFCLDKTDLIFAWDR